MSDRHDHPSSESWRLACPEGHRALVSRGAGYRCRTCAQTYDSEDIVDVKTGREGPR